MQIYRKPADGSGDAELLTTGLEGGAWGGASWTPDGGTIVFTRFDDNQDLMSQEVDPGGQPSVLLKTDANELHPAVTFEGASLRAGRPREIAGTWSVGPDGAFAVTLLEPQDERPTGSAVVTFVFDWPAELERLVP